MKTSIWTRMTAIAITGCAVAAFAAPAFGNGSVRLHRDGSQTVPFVAEVGTGATASSNGPALRRDGSKAVPFVAQLESTAPSAADGFDWGDAAIGAGGITGVIALGLGGFLGTRRLKASPHRHRMPAATSS